MRHFAGAVVVSCSLVFDAPCALATQASQAVLEELLTIEREALSIAGCALIFSQGYLGIFSHQTSVTLTRPPSAAWTGSTPCASASSP